MIEYPYIRTIGTLRDFLDEIPAMTVPDSATTDWLPSVGFAATHHRAIIEILKFVGFLNGDEPTERWIAFRDGSQAKHIMAQGIWEGYGDLFAKYEDAHERSAVDLKSFFSGKMPTADDWTIASTALTFMALCAFADFSELRTNGSQRASKGNGVSSGAASTEEASLPDLAAPHIDFQVHIAADAPAEQIDQIFASAARHLYGITLENAK